MVLQMELDESTLPNPNERARNRAIEGPEVVVDPIGKTHRLLDRLQLNDYPCSIVALDRRRNVRCSGHNRDLLALQWWQLRYTRNRYMLEDRGTRSEEHTSELQSRGHLVCRLLLEKKNNN